MDYKTLIVDRRERKKIHYMGKMNFKLSPSELAFYKMDSNAFLSKIQYILKTLRKI